MMFLYRQQRSIEDELLLAHIGLLGNPTITTYTIDDKGEIVYDLPKGDVFRGMINAMEGLCEAARLVQESLTIWFDKFRAKEVGA